MKQLIFHDFDFSDFWEDNDYSLEQYVNTYPTDELIGSIEVELGYKLPASYIELMKMQNGGIPQNKCYPTTERTSWSENHIAINGIMGVGRIKPFSLCGSFGNHFIINEWEYPNTGVYICSCPSAGHDMVMLDYSNCGKDGEPEVVHIDQELDYRKTFLAKNFESFIRGLVSSDVYDTSKQELFDTLEILRTGRFSDILQTFFKKDVSIDFENALRNLFIKITNEKGYFGLHDDPHSYLAYDIQFYLLSINKPIKSREEFAKEYPPMVALGNNEISTGGYASFYLTWFDDRWKSKQITKKLFGQLTFTTEFKKILFDQVKRYV